MESESIALRKEMQNIFEKIESGLHRRDEKMMKDAVATGERLLSRLSWKPAIAEVYSKLGNAHSRYTQIGLFLTFRATRSN